MTGFFPEVKDRVRYEGPESRSPLAFRWYDRKRKVRGKTMEAHLKFAVAYWHTFKGTGTDPFGPDPVYRRPWDEAETPLRVAEKTLDAAFEFFTKLGVPYYCFHDRDLAPEGATPLETRKLLERLVRLARRKQNETGVRLLWGTANLFSHPRYTHGAATNPDPRVFAQAATQVKQALDATIRLGGSGYVFWGGREGYSSLINTNMKQEREQLAALLHMAVEHGRKRRFKGRFFLEPKAKEPSVHQYDFDCGHCLNFLREFDLTEHFRLNVEANHATLATHSFEHELQTAADAGMLGSVDVNTGLSGVGWDTDNFAMDLRECVLALQVVQGQGGLPFGGLNFDAKVRRGSFDTVDLFHAHIGSMDTFARALLIVERMRKDGILGSNGRRVRDRYSGYRRGMGKRILRGEVSLSELEAFAEKAGEPTLRSGRQEELEAILNDYLYCTEL